MNPLPHLILGCLLASSAAAQSPNPPSSNNPASQTHPSDTSKGQDVAGNPQPPTGQTTQTPPTAGQSAATGNNLVAGNNAGQMQNNTAARPEFKTLDLNQRGYLMIGDVDQQSWLKSHFAQCDSDHDGRVTEREYAGCGK